MIYLKNYKDKIYKSVVLTAPEKLAIPKQIIDKEAQIIISNMEDNFKVYSEVEDIDELKCHKICQDICVMNTTDDQIKTYFTYI